MAVLGCWANTLCSERRVCVPETHLHTAKEREHEQAVEDGRLEVDWDDVDLSARQHGPRRGHLEEYRRVRRELQLIAVDLERDDQGPGALVEEARSSQLAPPFFDGRADHAGCVPLAVAGIAQLVHVLVCEGDSHAEEAGFAIVHAASRVGLAVGDAQAKVAIETTRSVRAEVDDSRGLTALLGQQHVREEGHNGAHNPTGGDGAGACNVSGAKGHGTQLLR